MRISDWSSDVCSSDLGVVERAGLQHHDLGKDRKTVIEAGAASGAEEAVDLAPAPGAAEDTGGHTPNHGEGGGRQDYGDGEGAAREAMAVHAVAEIGRASRRVRGCQEVQISVVVVVFNNTALTSSTLPSHQYPYNP